MRRAAFILWAAALAAACDQYGGPSRPLNVYALARVGANHLPISLNGDGTPPFLLADTLRLVDVRARTGQQVLRETVVTSDPPGGMPVRAETEFTYWIEDQTLTIDNCPRGFFCAASLVYMPRVFQIVGDSLFEAVPAGVNLPPHIYGLVRFP